MTVIATEDGMLRLCLVLKVACVQIFASKRANKRSEILPSQRQAHVMVRSAEWLLLLLLLLLLLEGGQQVCPYEGHIFVSSLSGRLKPGLGGSTGSPRKGHTSICKEPKDDNEKCDQKPFLEMRLKSTGIKEKGKLSGTGRDQQKRAGSTARTGRARGMDKVKQGYALGFHGVQSGTDLLLTPNVLSLPGPLQLPSQKRKDVVTRRASFNDIVAGRFDSDRENGHNYGRTSAQ
ncbi:hypothetical protein NEUTE2DRAFT_131511 [Neurospora tetrasperma FGSC 2509]|nr:hypothetical protein NEUTE2DRAFT_131511 [Neurospora tetrasperma FGSC 2509]